MSYSTISSAITFLTANAKKQPSLEEVAAHVHVSPFHLQRMFTEWAGVSPKKFLQYLTVGYAKNLLLSHKQISLFETAGETGLSGTGRLHDLFVNIEAMTPAEYRDGGKNLDITYSTKECAFGNYLVASTQRGICHLAFYDEFPDQVLLELKNQWPLARFYDHAHELHQAVQLFFTKTIQPGNRLTLHLQGTPFQLKIWEALLNIPEGKLTTYGNLAGEVENPTASRAVGSAVARNPVGFIIPCHRVIRNAGIIGEFRWGTSRKKAMIAWEAAANEQKLLNI